MREAGAYVIASYFEAARARAAPARRAPSSDAGGYLRGGEIPAAWVARLFEAARALAPHLLESHLRANVSGAVTFEGDVFLGWDEISLARRGEHHDCLEISLVPRSELDEEHRALRAHHGWALARGRLAPLVYGLTPGEEGPVEREATREEVALALAIAETMAADIPTVLYDDRGGTVCRDVDLDGFSLRVELDVPDVDEASDEHDAGEHDSDEHDPEDDADLDSLDDEYDDEDDEDEDEHEIDWELGVMLRTEAFEDWAIDRGLAPKIASLGTYFAAQLFDYVRNHVDSPTAWADPVTVEGFLLRHAPRKILLGADDEIDRALDGLAAYFEWSRTVRLLDEARARRLDATIRRAAPKYAAAMRDPSCFGLAKGMFHEMRRAGVDVEDQSQIDAYLAEVNRRSREVLVAPIQDAAPANPAPRRWTRAPGEPAPDPKGPCPCGSGKRYKKCCMPR